MLKELQGLPAGTIGFEAEGEVTAQDYETVLIPRLDEAVKQYAKVKFLYVLSPTFTGFTSHAMWDDAKAGIKHLMDFEKIAVVTDNPIIRTSAKVFTALLPCEIKLFDLSHLKEAKRWLEE